VRTAPGAAQQVDGAAGDPSTVRRYETPTFDPRSAFARTLRSAEIARRERPLDRAVAGYAVAA